jgi:hypothetical protein
MLAMGIACALIACYHFALGQSSVPGAGPVSPTIDSRERFYSGIFFGFGIAWIWAARQSPISAALVRGLSCVFLLGGLGRVLSWVETGRPHWLQIAEMIVELILPFVFVTLASTYERAHTRTASNGSATTTSSPT